MLAPTPRSLSPARTLIATLGTRPWEADDVEVVDRQRSRAGQDRPDAHDIREPGVVFGGSGAPGLAPLWEMAQLDAQHRRLETVEAGVGGPSPHAPTCPCARGYAAW